MVRILRQTGTTLTEDTSLGVEAPLLPQPSPAALAAAAALRQDLDALAADTRAGLATLTDERLKRSVVRGLTRR